MYWHTTHQSSPQIETVLAKEDLTLSEVLDQENILQELKSPNTKLIEFITRSDILDELITLIIEEPSPDIEEQERYRRPNLACEVLTTDIPRLNESLSDVSLLTKLYSFLEKDPPLNPLLASFFSRTLSLLICRKSDQNWYSYQFTCLTVLDFLKSREDSLKLLLKHLGTSAIMDLTLKLITQVEGEAMQQNLVDWLENEELILSIIKIFHPSVESDRQCNAAQLLCDTIRKFRERDVNTKENSKPDPILDIIQSPEMIKKLLEQMLESGEVSESSIAGGISVLLTLLEPPVPESPGRRNPYISDDSAVVSAETQLANPALPSIVLAILPFLPKLHDLLINPPKKPPFRLACGVIDPPLGNTRLTVIKLIAALISTHTPEVNEKLDELNTVQVLLDLFFRYTWNNFLHSQVDKCLAFALNSSVADAKDQNPLISCIFVRCRLLQRILDAWEENEDDQNKGGKRKGYMGHLINIANSVLKQVTGNLKDFIGAHVDQETMTRWDDHVENRLKSVNEIQSRYLGGSHPARVNSQEGFVPYDEKTSQFEKDELSELNESSSAWKNAVENFAGIYLGEREEKDDASSTDYQVRKMMFEQLCATRRASADLEGDDKDWDGNEGSKTEAGKPTRDLEFYMEDEEVWEDLPTSVWNNEDARSSSDEEEDKPLQEKMESIWSGPIADPADPWGSGNDNGESNNDGWANFDGAEFSQPLCCSTPPSESVNPEELQDTPVSVASERVVPSEIVSSEPVDQLHNSIDNDPKEINVNSEPSPSEAKVSDGSETPLNANPGIETDRPLNANAAGDESQTTVDSASDNNANLKTLTEGPLQKELYSRICSPKNNANEKSDDVPNSLENTPSVTKSSDSSPQPAVTGGSTKTAAPPDPV